VKHLLNSRLQVPTFGPAVVLSITLLWVSLTLTRGIDYLLNDTPGSLSAILLDLDFGLKRLGAVLILSALAFFAAVASQRHIAVWFGHALLAAAYFGMSLTVGDGVYRYGAGISVLIPCLGGLIWHVGMMWAMGVVPRATREGVRDARATG
jgi:hypothetical protein